MLCLGLRVCGAAVLQALSWRTYSVSELLLTYNASLAVAHRLPQVEEGDEWDRRRASRRLIVRCTQARSETHGLNDDMGLILANGLAVHTGAIEHRVVLTAPAPQTPLCACVAGFTLTEVRRWRRPRSAERPAPGRKCYFAPAAR